MGTLHVEQMARAGFSDLTQAHVLKPTAAFALIESVFADAWQQLAGRTRDAYFAAHPLRPVFTFLHIRRDTTRLDIDAPLQVQFTGHAGHYAGRDGRRRYGLRDEARVLGPRGDVVLAWTAAVLWMRRETGGLDGFLDEPAPDLLLDQDEAFEAPPARPSADVVEAGGFRWSPRETDINRHVFFQSYLERAENTLADGGADAGAPLEWSLWFQRPAFLGEPMRTALGRDGEHHVVQLSREDGAVCCTVRAT